MYWPACWIHDHAYEAGSSRAKEDARFRRNLLTCGRLQRVPAPLNYAVAWGYWLAVRVLGRGRWRAAWRALR